MAALRRSPPLPQERIQMTESAIIYAALTLCYAAYVSVAFCFVTLAVVGLFAVLQRFWEKP